VVLKTDDLYPGPYQFEVKAQGSPGGEFRHVAHRPFRIIPFTAAASAQVGLAELARIARERLRGHQDAHGYWLTAGTPSTRFKYPQAEMNLFVPALIIDLLDPVAKAASLEEELARARRHLLSHIEAGGLVRYYGRPDLPTNPSPGLIITPDADDTSVVWRVAGPKGEARLAGVLDALKAYQAPDGLYRTWLAPQKEYVNVGCGNDTNPTDVGVQMHVLLLLAEVDPPAAKSLHRALQSTIGEERLWVWYRQAPLLLIWREAELNRLGYPVSVPPDRLKLAVPEQAIWVAGCRHLARYVAKTEPRPDPAQIQVLLESLGKNNFAIMRCNPPLLYHHDLTAKHSAYYWSEDFGYALWVRLYLEFTRSSDISRLKP
jgi:hypothetical protein